MFIRTSLAWRRGALRIPFRPIGYGFGVRTVSAVNLGFHELTVKFYNRRYKVGGQNRGFLNVLGGDRRVGRQQDTRLQLLELDLAATTVFFR